MYSLLKHLREKQYYALWFALSAAFFLTVQYPNLNALAKLLFSPQASSKAQIVLQADLVDFSKGSFLVRNPISGANQSITDWRLELKCQPEGCSVKTVEIHDHAAQLLCSARDSAVIKPAHAPPINPGTFIRVDYELSQGHLDDIIVSGDNFGISLKGQKKEASDLKTHANWLKIFICLIPIATLLVLLYDKNQQIGVLKAALRKKRSR